MAEKKFGVREINVINPTGTPTIESVGALNINAGTGNDVGINTNTNISGTVSDSAGSLRNLPQLTKTSSYTLDASDTGKHVSISSGGVTVPSGIFSVGDVVTIFNNSSSTQVATQGSSVTLRQAGTTGTGSVTIDPYGVITILCVSSNVFVVSGYIS